MQHRALSAMMLAAAVAIGACSGDSIPSGTLEKSPVGAASTGGSDSSATNPTPPATSNGPVASVIVSPHQMTLAKGWFREVTATALDAQGVIVAGKQASFRSSNEDVATVQDTGVVFAKEPGTAKVYATIDGHTDSATVTVIAQADTVITSPPPPPTGLASFNLQITVGGIELQGQDTTHSSPIAGATVKLTRVGGVRGDTLTTSVDAGSAVTDANGVVSFTALDGGAYTVDVVPPASSPYAAIRGGFGPPMTSDVKLVFNLWQKK